MKVTLNPVMKNNGVKKNGITIKEPNSNVAPNIYLEDFDNFDAMPREELAEKIIRTYEKVRIPTMDFNFFSDFEQVKSKVKSRLINAAANAELLKTLPHRIICDDLALIYTVDVTDFVKMPEGGHSSVRITNDHANIWGVSEETLYELSGTNNDGPVIGSVMEFISQIYGLLEETPDFQMYLLTNKKMFNGANQIVNASALEDYLGTRFLLIPSSVHELIAIPEDAIPEDYKVVGLANLIREVNTSDALNADEVLSDHPYLYDHGVITAIAA